MRLARRGPRPTGFVELTGVHIFRTPVAVRFLGGGRGLALRLQFFVALERRVGAARADKQFGVGVVERQSLSLKERSHAARIAAKSPPVRGLEHRPLIPFDAKPRQILHDPACGLLAAAGQIGVLDTEDETAAVSFGERPAEQGGAGAADMQVPGW